MHWQLIVALVVAIPVILFPTAYVWYINIGSAVQAIREAKTAREMEAAIAKTSG